MPPKTSWNELVRTAIRESGLSLYAIAKQADIDVAPIQRFMADKHGMTLATAEKLAPIIGLKIRIKRRKGR
jgi:ribosome-binding protein aMBF1 (putative translation factor)